MYDLLIHEGTFARLEGELKSRAAAVRPIVLCSDETFRGSDGEAFPGDVAPHIGYGTPDVWFTPLAPIFVRALLQTPELKWFQSSAAGLEHPILQALGQKALQYTSSHAQSEAIAEWVLWAGFDWFQGGLARRSAQADKQWSRLEFRELADTHWIIVGFGAIGRSTARRLRALGAEVTGVRRTPGPDADADRMITPGELEGVLGKADAVLLCCPLTDETENLADAAFFGAMKPDALFANVGRGKLVDEAALLAGLSAGRPAYAALDVVSTEPLPPDNPIWSHRQITLTAHISANTMGSARRTDRVFIENLDRFVSGDSLVNLVPESQFQVASQH